LPKEIAMKAFRVVMTAVVVGMWVGAAGAQPIADHLKCYKVKDSQARATYAAHLAGLADSPGCLVKVPGTLLCVETTKTEITPTPPGGGDDAGPAGRFMCYKVKCPKAVLAPVQWHDQFGDRPVTPSVPKILCAPEIVAQSTTTTTTVPTTTTTLAPAGAPCSGPAQCASGVCLGHACCFAACDTSSVCGASACSGTGACMYASVLTVCGAPACTGGVQTGAGMCNGLGG
jgi:hypothetical protein